ncbi:unnamed protein product [Lepidochelys olivacea]
MVSPSGAGLLPVGRRLLGSLCVSILSMLARRKEILVNLETWDWLGAGGLALEKDQDSWYHWTVLVPAPPVGVSCRTDTWLALCSAPWRQLRFCGLQARIHGLDRGRRGEKRRCQRTGWKELQPRELPSASCQVAVRIRSWLPADGGCWIPA